MVVGHACPDARGFVLGEQDTGQLEVVPCVRRNSRGHEKGKDGLRVGDLSCSRQRSREDVGGVRRVPSVREYPNVVGQRPQLELCPSPVAVPLDQLGSLTDELVPTTLMK